MFDKKKSEELESIIGKNTQVDGNITTKGTIRIDGRLNGNVKADWVVLGEKSFVRGDIQVAGALVAGYVEGSVSAKEIIEVKRTGQVRGDVATSKLVVIEGGMIDGKVGMQQKEGAKVVELNKEMRTEATQ